MLHTSAIPLTLCLFFASMMTDVSADDPNVVPISPMVPMFHKWDMEKAADVVDKAADLGETQVQFCITLVSELNDKFEPQNFGLLRENRDGSEGNTFYPSDEELRIEMKQWLAESFARAVARELKISVLLHLNPHGPIQEWRNNFDFDPTTPLDGTSYENALVVPVMEALEQTLPTDWPVQISLQGEMGRTVFGHPEAWQKVLERARQRGKLNHAKFGLSFNHEAVSGQLRPDESRRAALGRLWNQCDYIGISMYQRLSSPPTADDLFFNVGRFVGEFYGLGCPLPEAKSLQFAEFGLGGGGRSVDGQVHTPALSAEDAARAPYLGTSNEVDNPWTNDSLVQVRRQTYEALCDFASRPMTRHRVNQIYLWSFGSWDVHGIASPAFADQEIVRRLQQHNRKTKR